MTRYIIEEINGLFYVSLGRSFTRQGQHRRINVHRTREEAEAQIAEWTAN